MAVISLRPDLDQNVDALPLYISGTLPNGKPGLAYEGRLQIHNAVGACTVEQVGGGPLPAGGALSVDHGTMEVVVAWPEYSEFVTPLQNPSFESGDLSGWTLTPKGGNATATADTSQKFDGAYSLRWPGGKGLGSEGGIEVEAWNNTIGPCLPGQRVTTHARCMYNPGGHNFGSRYQGLLRFVDGAGMPIGPAVRGKLFKGRGNNGRWNDASATAIGPAGTKGVQMGAWLTGSNAPVWLDAASWDVPSSVGINIETTLCITLRVRDSAGRTALWSGCIELIEFSWDGSWTRSKNIPGFTTNCVAYSPVHARFVAMGYVSAAYIAAAVYTSGVDADWTATPTPPNPLTAARSVIWADELGIFIACGLNSGGAWSADGTSWAATSGPNQGIIPCWGSGFGYQVGGVGSAQVKQSTNGKNWSWSGITLPSGGNMGTCVSIAYSPTLNKFVTVGYSGRGAMHNTSYSEWAWCTFDGVAGAFGGAAFAEVLWNPKDEHFYAFMGISNPTVYRSADGFNFTTFKTLPILPIQCAAFSPAFGYVVVTAADLYRYDDNFELIETRASPSLGQSFTLRWEESLGKFILTYAEGFAISNSIV